MDRYVIIIFCKYKYICTRTMDTYIYALCTLSRHASRSTLRNLVEWQTCALHAAYTVYTDYIVAINLIAIIAEK